MRKKRKSLSLISKLLASQNFSKSIQYQIISSNTTKEIQIEVNELKAQVRNLRHEITNLKATDLELHAKLSIMETQIPSSSHIPDNFQNIENIPNNEVSQEQFFHTISQVTIQKMVFYGQNSSQ